MPAQSIRKTKGAAEPSRIGISGASTSMTQSSTPQPARAASTCYTVPIRASPAGVRQVSAVQRRVSVTRS